MVKEEVWFVPFGVLVKSDEGSVAAALDGASDGAGNIDVFVVDEDDRLITLVKTYAVDVSTLTFGGVGREQRERLEGMALDSVARWGMKQDIDWQLELADALGRSIADVDAFLIGPSDLDSSYLEVADDDDEEIRPDLIAKEYGGGVGVDPAPKRD